MGCVCSKPLGGRLENISLLASQTFFSETEVEVLHELFIKLTSCVSSYNLITKEGFQFILTKDTKRRSLSAERMFGLFDMRNDGAIDFGEFVHSLNIFHPNSSQRDKATLAFRLYDTRQTGFIEPEETFEEADMMKDGKIDLEEWENFVAMHPLTLKNMTIPFLKDLPRTFPSFLQYKSDIDR
ncbi:EF-hand domain-containing protein [Hirschfeldia incana]|nr:EF-hand domain-containing protein [Hirschfeldia incana]